MEDFNNFEVTPKERKQTESESLPSEENLGQANWYRDVLGRIQEFLNYNALETFKIK